MKITEPSFFTYPHGFTYSHFRDKWLFAIQGRIDNFKFGFDWSFFKRLNELSIYIGFFEINWTRIKD